MREVGSMASRVERLKLLSSIYEFVYRVDRVTDTSWKFLWFKIPRTRTDTKYLSIDEYKTYWHVRITNCSDGGHNRAGGVKAYAADFEKTHGTLFERPDSSGVYESAIGMYPVEKDEIDKIDDIYIWIRELVDLAYEQHGRFIMKYGVCIGPLLKDGIEGTLHLRRFYANRTAETLCQMIAGDVQEGVALTAATCTPCLTRARGEGIYVRNDRRAAIAATEANEARN